MYQSKCEFSLKDTCISKLYSIRFLPPAVSIPHSEKIRFTNACDAGEESRSWASFANRGYTVDRTFQKVIESVAGEELRMSMRYLDSSVEDVSTASVRAAPATAVCFATRNVHFSDVAGTFRPLMLLTEFCPVLHRLF